MQYYQYTKTSVKIQNHQPKQCTTHSYVSSWVEALPSSCTQSRFHIAAVYPVPRYMHNTHYVTISSKEVMS